MTCLSCLDRENRDFGSGCACDHSSYPPCDPIPPGLSVLPPQLLGFPELRESLLVAAGAHGKLDGWAARSTDDLGVMLLESWAYVLDVVHFYNRRHQSRGYISTAPDALSLGRVVSLIGYRPRPATGGKVTVAALASDKGPAEIPVGMQVRSQGVPSIPPQIFEVDKAATVDPRNNQWTSAPLRSPDFSGVFAFASGASGVSVGQVVAVTLNGLPHAGARVARYAGTTLSDGADYRVATLDPVPTGLLGRRLDEIALFGMAQSATPTTFPLSGASGATGSSSRTEWVLDSVYPQLVANELVVVETVGGGFVAQRLAQVTSAGIELGTAARSIAGKATKIVLSAPLEMRRLHFRGTAAGPLTNPAETSIDLSSLEATQLRLEAPMADRTGVPEVSRLIVSDKSDLGGIFDGEVANADLGAGEASLDAVGEATASRVNLPLKLHGNIIELSRGQTVANEVLGSADAGQAYQHFRLQRKPLTYYPDPANPGLVRPELEVRVNGILWTRVDSFLAAPRGAQVYVVRHTDDGEADIIFGDAVRPPSGVDNVTATYRFGAGALSPPPGKLTQIVGNVPNLARIIAPLAVRGGSDAEAADSIRSAAPRSTRAQGRAVSLADYAAITSSWPGVIASKVDWAWMPGLQRAGICAWIICSGGNVSDELKVALAAAGDPLTAIDVSLATPSPVALSIDIGCNPAFVAAEVVAAVQAALLDSRTGLLTPQNAVIGGAIFRSRIVASVSAVPGVAEIREILANGATMPAALQSLAGHYLAFNLTVGGS